MEDPGADTELKDITSEDLQHVLDERWESAAAATWNNRLAVVGSFRRWARAQGWVKADLFGGDRAASRGAG